MNEPTSDATWDITMAISQVSRHCIYAMTTELWTWNDICLKCVLFTIFELNIYLCTTSHSEHLHHEPKRWLTFTITERANFDDDEKMSDKTHNYCNTKRVISFWIMLEKSVIGRSSIFTKKKTLKSKIIHLLSFLQCRVWIWNCLKCKAVLLHYKCSPNE